MVIKLAFLDSTKEYTEKLNIYLKENQIKDEWVEEMLKSVKLHESLAVYYEINGQYEEAINNLSNSNCEFSERIEHLRMKIKPKNDNESIFIINE